MDLRRPEVKNKIPSLRFGTNSVMKAGGSIPCQPGSHHAT